MLIRAATVDDIPALTEMLTVLFSQEAEFTPDPAAQARGLRRIISEPAVGLILIATEGEQALGMVNLLFTVSTALGERVALLEDMVIMPTARSAGLGARLLGEAVAAARDAGCRRITLLTDHDNLGAQRFYARQGFAPSSMLPMRLYL